MIQTIVSDFSRVLLFPIDPEYRGGLNALHAKLSASGEYNVWEHFRLNQELLALYAELGRGMPIYLFSSEYIQEDPMIWSALDGIFRDTFSAARLDLKKDDPAAYASIAASVGVEPRSVLYIDDQQMHVDAAARVGMATIRFMSNGQAMRDIRHCLESVGGGDWGGALRH